MTDYPPQPRPRRPVEPTPRGGTPLPPADDGQREQTIPLRPVGAGGTAADPTILGFPPEPPEDDGTGELPDGAAPDVSREAREAGPAAGAEQQSVAVAERPAGELGSPDRVVVLRRAERVGGVALLLAGLTAAVSLWLPWGQGLDTTGLVLVWRGVDALASGELGDSGLWQPLAVVLGGAVLFLLGLLLFRRAHTHRLVGVLALLVSVTAAAGVLVLLADAGWDTDRLDLGMWFATAVPALGLLGALKAMLTTPRVTLQPR
jgi:hypothetical protein